MHPPIARDLRCYVNVFCFTDCNGLNSEYYGGGSSQAANSYLYFKANLSHTCATHGLGPMAIGVISWK